MNIQLIALDLDGTTVRHDTSISARVRRAVSLAQQQHIRVTVATGRNVPSTRPFAEQLGITEPVICCQGGLIYDLTERRTLRRVVLDHALACEVLALAERFPSWHSVVYQNDGIFVSDLRLFNDLHHLIGFNPQVVNDLCQLASQDALDKVLFTVPPDDAPRAQELLRELVKDRALVVRSHAQFVEVNPIGADKGSALAWLAEHLHVPREQVMAIGDQGNDVTMIAWAGFGVAMGNGSAEAKAVADWIAPSIDEDGAAVAMERFALRD